ncbi:uncharacterized protein Dana_GF26872, partial [Drosophila ananassae]
VAFKRNVEVFSPFVGYDPLKVCGGPCVCKKGYIIDTSIPACVLRSDCPKDVDQIEGVSRVTEFRCFGLNKSVTANKILFCNP